MIISQATGVADAAAGVNAAQCGCDGRACVDPAPIDNIITNYFSGPGTAVAFGGSATVRLANVRLGDLDSLVGDGVDRRPLLLCRC